MGSAPGKQDRNARLQEAKISAGRVPARCSLPARSTQPPRNEQSNWRKKIPADCEETQSGK